MPGAWEQALVLYLGSKLQSRQPNNAEASTALAAILLKHWVRQLQPQGQSNLRIALELTTTAGEHLDDLLHSVWPEADRRAARMHVTGLLCETISQQASLCSCGHPTAVLAKALEEVLLQTQSLGLAEDDYSKHQCLLVPLLRKSMTGTAFSGCSIHGHYGSCQTVAQRSLVGVLMAYASTHPAGRHITWKKSKQ